jgi:hypothetical protein
MPCSKSRRAGVLVVGGGPAGLGPLFAAASSQRLDSLLASGVVIVDNSGNVGSGGLGEHAIRSDSAAEALLDVIKRTDERTLADLHDHPTVAAVSAHAGRAVPLSLAAELLHLVGRTMIQMIKNSAFGRVHENASALFTRQVSPDEWNTLIINHATGRIEEICSTSVVLATGAYQPEQRLFLEEVAGEPLLPRYSGKVFQSGYVLTHAGIRECAAKLGGKKDPRVVIVGGSASAGAVGHALLHLLPGQCAFGEGGVSLLHRRRLNIFFNSVAEAQAEGYTEFGPEDVCPLTGRVHRLGGLRFDSRDVVMAARGMGGRTPDKRLRLLQLEQKTMCEARALLDGADMIIAAMGYRPRALPVIDVHKRPIPLLAQAINSNSLVDDQCRVLSATGEALAGLFGIGLASGIPHTPEIGGETNFTGQINSLWLWQHLLGLRIVKQVQERSSSNCYAL